MIIINIGSKLDLLNTYFSNNITLSNLFSWGIYNGKPLENQSWLTLYFRLESNKTLVDDDSKRNLTKRSTFEFVIITNQKNIPDVEIYEALDTLINEITDKEIDLSWFKIKAIREITQSWILVDTNENPCLIAQFQIDYKSQYL